MEELKRSHEGELSSQKQIYSQDLDALEKQFILDKEQLAKSLKDQHGRQYKEIQQAHQLAVQSLREILQHQSLEQLEEAQAEHSRKMAELQVDLSAEHDREKKTLRDEHEMEARKHQEQIKKLMAEKDNQVGPTMLSFTKNLDLC